MRNPSVRDIVAFWCLLGLGMIVICIGIQAWEAKKTAESFNRLTGSHVTAQDAMFVPLRVANPAHNDIEWLYGCNRVVVQSTELKDGKPVDVEWFDEQRIEVTDQAGPVAVPRATTKEIQLGSKVKDCITGYAGTAVAQTSWLSGMVDISVEAPLHEGKPVQIQGFSLSRIELVTEEKPPVSKDHSSIAGGPQHDPRPSHHARSR